VRLPARRNPRGALFFAQPRYRDPASEIARRLQRGISALRFLYEFQR